MSSCHALPNGCRGCKGPKCRNDNKDDNNGASMSVEQPSQSTGDKAPDSTKHPLGTTEAPYTNNKPAPTTIPTASQDTRHPAGTTAASRTTLGPVVSSLFSSSASSASSSATATSTLSCKALAALDTETGTDDNTFRMRSYPIDLSSRHLERRVGQKEANACAIKLRSFNYPSSGDWKQKPKVYGFNEKDSCENYDSSSPDAQAEYDTEHVLEWQLVASFFTQMGEEITRQFVHPDPESDPKLPKLSFCQYWEESWNFDDDQKIDNPLLIAGATPVPIMSSSSESSKPPRLSTVSSTSSVISSSSVAISSVAISSVAISSVAILSTVTTSIMVAVSTPVTPASAGASLQAQKLTPFHWLASQYPYKDSSQGGEMWLEELPLLDRRMNGQNKEKIFSQKKNAAGVDIQIRDSDKMQRLIQGRSRERKLRSLTPSAQAIIVILRLREMTGTLKYMQETDVAEIFGKEKKRIGAMIASIDKELHRTPRQVTRRGKTITYAPWIEQKLGERWDKYMDNVFTKAKTKATDYMNLHLGNLDNEWDSPGKRDEYKPDPKDNAKRVDEKKVLKKAHEDILAYIKKTRVEWDKVKNWEKPANWV